MSLKNGILNSNPNTSKTTSPKLSTQKKTAMFRPSRRAVASGHQDKGPERQVDFAHLTCNSTYKL